MVYTIASSDNPNANATPTNPMWPPASTALPTPPNTSTNVPRNSARYFRKGGDLLLKVPGVYMRVTQGRRILTREAGVLDEEIVGTVCNTCVRVGPIRSGAPGGIRTPDPLLRRQILYPAELRAQLCEFNSFA